MTPLPADPPSVLPPGPPGRPPRPLWLGGLAALALLLGGLFVVRLADRVADRLPRLTETDVRRAVVTTIEREAEASFYVTGTLGVGTTSTSRSTTTVLPGLLNLRTGTTDVTVRVPGRVAYGFDVRALGAEDIRLGEDGVVEVVVPPLAVFSVEPELEAAEIQTSVGGWERLRREGERETTALALRQIRPAMRGQAEAHLATAEGPRANTAAALARLLTPPLQAAGMAEPRFRFVLGPGSTLEFNGEGRRRVVPLPLDPG